MADWMLLLTTHHAEKYLLGAAIGAAGGYLASKFTDKRRQKERAHDERQRFERVRSTMPELFAEMRKDLSEHPHVRDFFATERCLLHNSDAPIRFMYYVDDDADLQQKIAVLENNGYVTLVGEGAFSNIFRMQEDFVTFLKDS